MVDLIKQQKLRLFEHICHMNDQCQVNRVMLGMVECDQPCGKPARRWSHDITDWCCGTLPDAVHLANDRH